jgi:hypothetical protein
MLTFEKVCATMSCLFLRAHREPSRRLYIYMVLGTYGYTYIWFSVPYIHIYGSRYVLGAFMVLGTFSVRSYICIYRKFRTVPHPSHKGTHFLQVAKNTHFSKVLKAITFQIKKIAKIKATPRTITKRQPPKFRTVPHPCLTLHSTRNQSPPAPPVGTCVGTATGCCYVRIFFGIT